MFVADGDPYPLVMPVAARLRMRGDEGDISFHGSLRCTAHDRRRCFLPSTTFTGFFEPHDGTPTYGTRGYDAQFFRVYNAPFDEPPLCELTGATPFLRALCPGSIGGTFVCAAHDSFGPLSGTYGLTVDTCEPCTSRYER
jgi:hypothetical protein